MEKLGLASLLELAEKSGNIQLEAALESRVTDECLSIFNVDGSMRKTCKSKLLEFFDLDPVVRNPHNYVGLVDMGLIWRLVTPTPEDREAKKWDGSLYCWSKKNCSLIFSHHSEAKMIILVNDKYNVPLSIKDDGHD